MRRPDINFTHDDSHAFLPWVIGVMVGLATLLLCLGITVDGWIIARNSTYENRFSVTVPATTDNIETKFKLIKDTIEGNHAVSRVEVVTNTQLQNMLRTWIGDSPVDDLPLPSVLDVSLKDNAKVNFKELESQLSIIAPGTEISSQERWVSSFAHFSSALECLIAILAVLIIGCLALTVAFTSRASLKLHAKTVGLLHSIGAEDRYIASQFQQDACWLTMCSTVPGCLAAGLAYWGTGFYMASLETSMLPSFAMNTNHVLLLLIMPVACTVVSWLAARLSVLQQLQHRL